MARSHGANLVGHPAGAALFRCPATGVSRPANDAGFPPHHAARSAAVSATPKMAADMAVSPAVHLRPRATCRPSAHPPDHANPESLIADLIGIIFPAGQPAADLHGARPPRRLIPVAALDLYLQFYTSKIFPEMLC